MIIAEAYIHIDISERTAEQFGQLVQEIDQVAIRISEKYYPNTQFEIYIEEGSIRAKIKGYSIPLIVAVFELCANYSDLKNNIPIMYADAREFGNKFVESVSDIVGEDSSQLIYKRTISQDVNRLSRIIKKTDFILKNNLGETNKNKCNELVKDIKHDLTELLVHEENTPIVEKLISVLPHNDIPGLPKKTSDIMLPFDRQRRHVLSNDVMEEQEDIHGIQSQPFLTRKGTKSYHRLFQTSGRAELTASNGVQLYSNTTKPEQIVVQTKFT